MFVLLAKLGAIAVLSDETIDVFGDVGVSCPQLTSSNEIGSRLNDRICVFFIVNLPSERQQNLPATVGAGVLRGAYSGGGSERPLRVRCAT